MGQYWGIMRLMIAAIFKQSREYFWDDFAGKRSAVERYNLVASMSFSIFEEKSDTVYQQHVDLVCLTIIFHNFNSGAPVCKNEHLFARPSIFS
jgi:hypothetical protein